jgi:hypothetical protein
VDYLIPKKYYKLDEGADRELQGGFGKELPREEIVQP